MLLCGPTNQNYISNGTWQIKSKLTDLHEKFKIVGRESSKLLGGENLFTSLKKKMLKFSSKHSYL